MYCVKALGVGHFKGNWTNEKREKKCNNVHTVPFPEHSAHSYSPQSSIIDRAVAYMGQGHERTGETFVRLCARELKQERVI